MYDARFKYRGSDYTVEGTLWSGLGGDAASDGALNIKRVDGAPIPGSQCHPGMIYTYEGEARAVYELATRALRSAWRDPAKRRAHRVSMGLGY